MEVQLCVVSTFVLIPPDNIYTAPSEYVQLSTIISYETISDIYINTCTGKLSVNVRTLLTQQHYL